MSSAQHRSLPPTRHRRRRVALLAALLVTVGCSNDGDGNGGNTAIRADRLGEVTESGLSEDAKPMRGGQLVYGIEAESGDYCLTSAEIAAAGMQVVRAVYDPIVIPDSDGRYQPYLAKSVEPSADYKTWTITLKPDITFHDGTTLDATVLKNNLDAYRGTYPVARRCCSPSPWRTSRR